MPDRLIGCYLTEVISDIESSELTNTVHKSAHFADKPPTGLQDTPCAGENTLGILLTPMQAGIAKNCVELDVS
jgi:hypothetical protein